MCGVVMVVVLQQLYYCCVGLCLWLRLGLGCDNKLCIFTIYYAYLEILQGPTGVLL